MIVKPHRLPADQAKAIKEYLLPLLPGLTDEPGLTVALNLPAEWEPSASPPHVGVFDDMGPSQWPILTRPTIRVTVWADGRDRARTIAGRALGVLLSHRVPGVATITKPLLFPGDIDPHNGGHMASFAVSATARTLAV